jgi:hypothetical protein
MQPCWPSAAADLLRCDRVDQVLRATSRRRRPGFAHGPRRPSLPLDTTPWWRSRSCANERQYRADTTNIPALALVCSFIKQATANVRSLPMVAAVHCRATSTRAAGFLKAACLGQPLCVEPDAICEIRSTRDAPPPARSYLAVGWSVTNAWLTMALWPVRSLGRQGSEVDRGSKGAKGEVGLAKGSPFHPMPPALAAATISKMPVKPLPPSAAGVRGPVPGSFNFSYSHSQLTIRPMPRISYP